MATAVRAEKQTEEKRIELVLDWITEYVERDGWGDMAQHCERAARRAVRSGLVSGALWDESGAEFLLNAFRVKRVHPMRRVQAEGSGQPMSESQSRAADPFAIPFFDGEIRRAYGDMDAAALSRAIDYYDAQIKGYGAARDFLAATLKIVQQRGAKTPSDCMSADEVIQLRRKIDAES